MAQSYIPLNQTDSRTLSNAYLLIEKKLREAGFDEEIVRSDLS